ncbi:MAG: GtrA family protein [Clostridia bacterium]|nr:GtrA family protein [Clostridia bacterium]
MNRLLVLIKKNEEIVSYIFWGILTTVVSWCSYSALVWLFDSLKLSEMISVISSNMFSWIMAIVFAFVTNKMFVFKSRSWKREVLIPETVKFIWARVFTGVLELVLVPFLVFVGLNQTIFGIQGMLSKVIVTILVIIVNYIFSKKFIFKKASK